MCRSCRAIADVHQRPRRALESAIDGARDDGWNIPKDGFLPGVDEVLQSWSESACGNAFRALTDLINMENQLKQRHQGHGIVPSGVEVPTNEDGPDQQDSVPTSEEGPDQEDSSRIGQDVYSDEAVLADAFPELSSLDEASLQWVLQSFLGDQQDVPSSDSGVSAQATLSTPVDAGLEDDDELATSLQEILTQPGKDVAENVALVQPFVNGLGDTVTTVTSPASLSLPLPYVDILAAGLSVERPSLTLSSPSFAAVAGVSHGAFSPSLSDNSREAKEGGDIVPHLGALMWQASMPCDFMLLDLKGLATDLKQARSARLKLISKAREFALLPSPPSLGPDSPQLRHYQYFWKSAVESNGRDNMVLACYRGAPRELCAAVGNVMKPEFIRCIVISGGRLTLQLPTETSRDFRGWKRKGSTWLDESASKRRRAASEDVLVIRSMRRREVLHEILTRCGSCNMRELDVIVSTFLASHSQLLTTPHLRQFLHVMSVVPKHRLFAWISGQAELPTRRLASLESFYSTKVSSRPEGLSAEHLCSGLSSTRRWKKGFYAGYLLLAYVNVNHPLLQTVRPCRHRPLY